MYERCTFKPQKGEGECTPHHVPTFFQCGYDAWDALVSGGRTGDDRLPLPVQAQSSSTHKVYLAAKTWITRQSNTSYKKKYIKVIV